MIEFLSVVRRRCGRKQAGMNLAIIVIHATVGNTDAG